MAESYPYTYKGPVLDGFGNLLSNNWEGTTMATSPEKARTNLMYRFKKMTNRLPSVKIIFPGELSFSGK